jgi:hypothetical protein
MSQPPPQNETPDEQWLRENLDRINPNRHEMGSAGDTQALTILVFELRRENQRMEGEAKVLRDLLCEADDVIAEDIENAFDTEEQDGLQKLHGEIESALRGAP